MERKVSSGIKARLLALNVLMQYFHNIYTLSTIPIQMYLVHVGDHGGRERVKGYLQDAIQFPLVRLRDAIIA